MEDINTNIGENIKKIRKDRNLTIDALSADAGVSKGMISEIERGIRNPSITVLWKIANSLKMPLNYFLKQDNGSSAMVYKLGNHPDITGAGYTFHPLMDFDEDKKFEIYFTEYKAHTETDSSTHYKGVEEYACVTSGALTVCINEDTYTVREGEVIHFAGDKKHNYRNETGKMAKAFILMFYPS